MKNTILFLLTFVGMSLFGATQVQAQIEGVWFNEEKDGKVLIYEEDGKLYGKIIWLEEEIDPETGKAKVDANNPKANLTSMPIMNLIVLKNFVKSSETKAKNGKVYDPENGKTYSCYIELIDGRLKIRGYVGVAALGRTAWWTRAE